MRLFLIFNIFQFLCDGSRIVLMDKRGLRHLSGSFLTACADNLTRQEKDEVARSLVEGLAFLLTSY